MAIITRELQQSFNEMLDTIQKFESRDNGPFMRDSITRKEDSLLNFF